MQNSDLRPLGAGELLDRAITLYVRRFALIVTVLAAVIVPMGVLQALAAPNSAHAFADMARAIGSAGDAAASRAAADAMARDGRMTPLTGLVIFLSAVVRLLMWSAIIATLSSAYAGTRTTIGEAYRLGLQRWIPQALVALSFLVIGAFAMLPVLIYYVILVVVGIALSALHQIVVLIVALVAGGLILIAGICVLAALIFMAYELAAVAVVTETANPITAIGIGLRRALATGMKRRTIVAGLVLMLVSQAGALPLIAIAVVLTAIAHFDALYFAVLSVGAVLIDGLVAAFVVVYAVDVRVRREGLDIVIPEPSPIPA